MRPFVDVLIPGRTPDACLLVGPVATGGFTALEIGDIHREGGRPDCEGSPG